MIVLGLIGSFVFFAMPVTRAQRNNDPVYGHFTDHLRYRYCATLVVEQPINALITPLETLHSEDDSTHRVLTWDKEPCHAGGMVHVAIHAPFQWVLETEWLAPEQSTTIYVLINLFIAHLLAFLVLRSREHWYVAFFILPLGV